MKACFIIYIFSFLIIDTCNAQVPVSKEPRHHNVFQNQFVRVLDVHVVPGDTTLFHKHQIPSVFVVLSNAKSGSELISDGTTTNAPATYGNIWFDGFYLKPRIHRVWNNDTIEFHVMDIELLDTINKEINAPLQQKSISMLFNEKPVITYTCTLNSHSTTNINGRKNPMVVISLTDNDGEVTINDKLFKQKGDFIFIPAGNKNVYINKGTGKAQLAILELK